MNRYGFYTIFTLNPSTQLLSPNIDVYINGFYYPAGSPIPRGITFGGLDLYSFMGRDIAAYPNMPPAPPPTPRQTLTITGFY